MFIRLIYKDDSVTFQATQDLNTKWQTAIQIDRHGVATYSHENPVSVMSWISENVGILTSNGWEITAFKL
jgi:hypothetical protein